MIWVNMCTQYVKCQHNISFTFVSDFKPYTIIRAHLKTQGELEMAVKQLTEEGDIPHIMAKCVGIVGKANRLKAMRNCELLVQDQEIVGINADGDCVVQTKLAK